MITKVIGIAGGSGSGKTTIAEAILTHIGGNSVVLIQQDAYYRDLSHLDSQERNKINFDHPDALDNDLLITHLKKLKKGETVDIPVYDFSTHTRKIETMRVVPAEVILLEGILVLGDPRLRDLMDIKIFVDMESDIRFIRRLQRDIHERGRNLNSIIEQYISMVRPMHFEFVEQSRRYADVILPEGSNNHIAVDMIMTKIRSILNNVSKEPD